MAKNPFLGLFGGGQPDPNSMMQQLAGNDYASQLLQHYGLSLPQMGPNVVLPNQGFFGRHPRVSTGIENALIAMANIGPGRSTGESISNVARGLMSIGPTRDAMQMSRLMAPFGMAQQLQQMETGQANLDLMKAHANYYNGRANIEQQDNSLPYHSVHVGSDGNLWGVSKTTRKLEKIPSEKEGLFMPPGSGMGFQEELIKGMSGLLPAQQNMDEPTRKASVANYQTMFNNTLRQAGGKTAASDAAHYGTPGVMTPEEQAQLSAATSDAKLGEIDFMIKNPSAAPGAFQQFHADAVDRAESISPGITGERGTAPTRGSGGKPKRSPLAPPKNAADSIANDFFNAIDQSKKAKAIANNPPRFAASPTPRARIPGFYDIPPSFQDVLNGKR